MSHRRPGPTARTLPPRARRPRPLTVESLEDRLAPAIFTGAGPDLTIDLNNPNEVATLSTDGATVTVTLTGGTADTTNTGGHVAGGGTGTATFASATYNGTIFIGDSAAGTSVAFADSTGAYLAQWNVTLNDPASGSVTFAGGSTFNRSVTGSTTAGRITSDLSSPVTLVGGASNLNLTATGHDILLLGRVSVGGITRLTASVVQADNPLNDFVGALSLNTTAVGSVFDVNNLTLSTSALGFGSLGRTSRISAGANITQTGPLTTTAVPTGVAVTLALTSNFGSIALTNPGNSLTTIVGLALSVSAANTASVVNTAGLNLAEVTLGTGALSLTFNGNLTQQSGATVRTGGSMSLTVNTGIDRSISIFAAGNSIGGQITIAEINGGDVRDVSIRNASDNALPPTGAPLTAANDLRNLTLFFDNNGVVLPGYTITGNLTVTAGGDISQSALLTVPGTSTFTILGDFAITLPSNNAFGGAVSLNDPQSTRNVFVTNGSALALGPCDLGRGNFAATAVSGDITSTAAITQRKGTGFAFFDVPNGTTVSLTGANDFPGSVVFGGAGLTNVNVRNTDFQSTFANLALPGTVTDLTVTFDNAGIVLPSVTLTNLTVNALGIVQQPGSALALSGTGTFSAGPYALDLSNAGNDFNNLNVSNEGYNAVTVADANALTFVGNSVVGVGRLTVTAGGNITAAAGGQILQDNFPTVGDIVLTSTAGGVSLPNDNALRGPLSVAVSGANTVTLHNNSFFAPLVLGTVTTGTGAFAADAGPAGISQDPNSVLNFGGPSSFAAGTITLPNRTNTFGGPVALTTANAFLRATGPVVLAAGNVTGTLSVKTGGTAADSLTQIGAVGGGSVATFDAGAGDVGLTNAGNDFASVSVASTGSVVAVRDSGPLNVGTIRVGGGTLTLTTNGDLGTAAGGSIVQTTGAGAVTLDTPAPRNITLDSADNVLRGTVNVVHATDATVRARADLTFTTASAVTGNFTPTAGGTLTLPGTVNLGGSLTASAVVTPVGIDVAAAAGVSFTGSVAFAGNRTVTAAAVTFVGDVTAAGPLAFNLGPGQVLQLTDGTWDQGANPLTVNGPTAGFNIGDGFGRPARFVMAGGTVALPGGGNLTVKLDGTFQVGTTAGAAEAVTVANGTGSLTIDGSLAVGFGAVNDKLAKTGGGPVQIGPRARLAGSGLSAAAATPVLVSQTALITGRFTNSADADDAPHDFLAGGDIVTPAYSFTDVTVKAGGVAAPTGTAVGTLPDGDRFSVQSSLGAAAGLVTVVDLSGQLGVVVRNATAAGPSTLTLSALGGGDGQLAVSGVAVHTPGAVTVSAPAANFVGTFTTAGTLTALTARDLGLDVLTGFELTGGGPATGATSIAARAVRLARVDLAGSLKTFKAVSVGLFSALTARTFGTLTTTGLAAAGDPGGFDATLTSTTTATGPVLTSATVAGTLQGTWDLRGIVGTVKASRAAQWTLGPPAGANVRNGGLVTGAISLSLGEVVSSSVNAGGAVGGLTATEVRTCSFTAGSWGTVKVTGNPATGLVGGLIGSTLTATGNAAGVGLTSLSIAGDLIGGSVVRLLNGDATAITVGRTVNGSTITATDTGTRGTLKAVSAAGLQSATIDARSIGTLTVKANLAANLFGDVGGSTVTARGNALGIGIGTVSAAGSVTGSTFDVQSGNLTKLAAARQLGTTAVRLPDPAFGALGTIQAGDWAAGVTVLAETIGTAAAVGAPALAPASPLLLGAMTQDTITAYQNAGTAAALGKLTTKGDFSVSTAAAGRGIGTVTVGRTLSSSFLIADDAQPGAPTVGVIKTLTAGRWFDSTAAANTLGTIKVIGYRQPETGSNSLSVIPGDMADGTVTAAGGGAGVPGIAAVSAASLSFKSFLKAPFGIKALTVSRFMSGSAVVADNPAFPTAGTLAAVTVGVLDTTTVRAGSIGTLKVTSTGPLGSVARSTVAATATAAGPGGTLAIGSLTTAGDVTESVIDAPATVGSITVGGRVGSQLLVFPPPTGSRVLAGYGAGARLGNLTAGAWGQAGSTATTDLVTRAVGTFVLKGNAARGFAGTTDNGFIDILGNAAGVGLGTFTGTGTVANSLFRVSDGDVGSFTTLRFASSDLLVGFRPVNGSDLTLAPAVANWSATNRKVGSFTTSAAFDPSDPESSASFRDSTVVAAVLGAVTLSGVDPTDADATTFGVAFRTGAGAGAKGTVKEAGVTLTPGAADGQFHYLGLPG